MTDRPPVSGEPRTEAGRRLLRKARTVDGWHTNFDAGDILDVEAEARATPPALDEELIEAVGNVLTSDSMDPDDYLHWDHLRAVYRARLAEQEGDR